MDMGADEYTTGRPHPMIDGTARYQRVLTEAQDPGTAVLLLDFILGYNSSPDPVGDLHGAIVLARDNVRQRGGDLVVVASVCGTDDDHQGRAQQISKLEGAGVIVFESNCEATRYCASLLGDRGTS